MNTYKIQVDENSRPFVNAAEPTASPDDLLADYAALANGVLAIDMLFAARAQEADTVSTNIMSAMSDRYFTTDHIEVTRDLIALRRATLALGIEGKNAEERAHRLAIECESDQELQVLNERLARLTRNLVDVDAEIANSERRFRLLNQQLSYLTARLGAIS